MKKIFTLMFISLLSLNTTVLIAQQLMNLDAPTGQRFTITDKTWPANHGQADVCLWQADHLAAFTVTIDDNIESDTTAWKNYASTYGFNFTWFVINQATSGNVSDPKGWDTFRALQKNGHAVQGHDDRNWTNNIVTQTTYLNGTYTNDPAYTSVITLSPNFVMQEGETAGMTYSVDAAYPTVSLADVPSFATATENGLTGSINFATQAGDQGAYYISVIANDGTNEVKKVFRLGVNTTELEYYNRLLATRDKIDAEITADKCRTYAYPFGEGDTTEARKLFIAMRGTTGILNQANDVNYLDVNSVSSPHITANPGTYVDPLLDKTSTLYNVNYYRGWGSTHFHSIGSEDVDGLLTYLTGKDIWVATFPEVAAYSQSYATHALNITSVQPDEVRFTLNDEMNDTYFNFPLTVKIRVNNTWTAVSATQNGSAVSAQLITDNGNNYVLVNSVPDAGETVVKGTLSSNGNNAPVIAAIGNQTLTEGETLTVNISATDADATDVLTISASNLPSWATLTDNGDGTATLSLTPTYGDAGTYNNISIAVSDGTDSDSEGITITVNTSTVQISNITSSTDDGFVSDPAVITTNNPYTQPSGSYGMKLGKSAVDGSANCTSVIIPFQLPDITGKTITGASLKVYVNYGRQWINANVDLYGLTYKSTSTISANDYFTGAFGSGNGSDVGIADDFFTKNVAAGNLDTPRWEETQGTENDNLLNYIKAQYQAGAVAGNWVFLRLSMDDANMTGSQYFGIDDASMTNKPTLQLQLQDNASGNNAPVLAPIGNQTVNEGETKDVSLSATDADGNSLTFTVSGNPSWATLTDNGDGTAILTLAPHVGDAGTYDNIIVTVSDGTDTDSETFSIDVSSGNDAPVLATIGNQTVNEGETKDVALSATDADGNSLTFSVSGNPSWATLTDNGDGTAILTLAPQVGDAGTYDNIIVTVSDGTDTDSETISITVTDPNAIVILSDAGDGMVYDANVSTVNNPYTLDVSYDTGSGMKLGSSDNGGGATLISDILVFQLPDRPAGQVVTAGELTVDINWKRQWVIGAIDLYGLAYASTNAISADMHYDGQFVSNQNGVRGLQDDFWTAPAGGAIENPGTVTSSADAKTVIADYLNTQYDNGAAAGDYVFIRLSPDDSYQDNGNFVFITSGDGTNDAVKPKLSITFGAASSNNAPVLAAIGNQSANEGVAKTVTITASDDDASDNLTFSISGNPDFVSLTDNGDKTATLTIAAGIAPGTYDNITVKVTDGTAIDEETFSITVSDDPNLYTSKNAWENINQTNQTSNFVVEFDAVPYKDNMNGVIGISDGDVTTYSDNACIVRFNTSGEIDAFNTSGYSSDNAIAYMSGTKYHFKMDINLAAKTYTITVTPEGASAVVLGTDFGFRAQATQLNNVAIISEDGAEGISNIQFGSTSGNNAPVLAAIGNQTVNEGATKDVALSATDADGNSLTFSVSGNPTWTNLTDNGNGTAKLSLAPQKSDAGTYDNIIVTVSDGTDTDTETISITVNPNTVPVLDAIGNQTVNEGATKDVALSATDGDGDALAFTISGNPTWATLSDNGDGTAKLSLAPQSGDAGTYDNIVITVSDGMDTDTDTISINVSGTTGIDKITDSRLNVYPNPALNSKFTISMNGFEGKNTIRIMNLSGKILFMNEISSGSKTYQPNINLPEGSYIIILENDNNRVYKKLIVK